MRRFVWMVVVVAFVVKLSAQNNDTIEPKFDEQRKAALVVAVDEYAHGNLQPIEHSVRNADVIATLLREQGYSVWILTGTAATRGAIFNAGKALREFVGQGPSQVILFFSGHYYTVDEAGTHKEYLFAYDSDPNSVELTSVDVEQLVPFLMTSATRLIAFLDTTKTEAEQPKKNSTLVELLSRQSAHAYVLSSNSFQTPKARASSAFSDALVDGLAGEASMPDGTVNFRGLANYVSAQVNRIEPARLVLVAAAPATAYGPVISRNNQYAEVQVFYATDRARSTASPSGQEYGQDRSSLDRLDLGECRVSIPSDHRVGNLETASIFTFRKDPGKTVEILTSTLLPPESFWSDLGKAIKGTTGQQVMIFIHGYRTSFESAVRRTAQLTYDLQFPGPVIAYSWPSDDTPVVSLFRYTVDEANVAWTTQHFQDFLESVSNKFPGATIHLIAHSMGSRAVFDAIRTLPNTKAPPQIKQLILAAPDIDAATFEQLSETMAKRVGRATLYANSNDEALKASHEIHGYPRAGESGMALVVTRGVDTIDASEVDTGLIGHSYFADRRSVISDIYDLIRFGIGPDKRFGLTASDFHGPHWIFNP